MMHDDKEREKAGHLKLTENIANNITEVSIFKKNQTPSFNNLFNT